MGLTTPPLEEQFMRTIIAAAAALTTSSSATKRLSTRDFLTLFASSMKQEAVVIIHVCRCCHIHFYSRRSPSL